MVKKPELGHVVKEFYLDTGAHVYICDDYCRNQTKEQVEAILADIARKIQGPYTAELRRRIEQAQQTEQ